MKDPYRQESTIIKGKYNDYKLLSYVDSGGMGVVYKAIPLKMNSMYFGDQSLAVKMLKPDIIARNKEYAEFFSKEVENLEKVKHPNVATIFDNGITDEGVPFMVMEWLNGETLDKLIAKAKLEIRDIARLFGQICLGLAAVHDLNIIHLDIKPANVFILPSEEKDKTSTYKIKLIDFGLSRIIVAESGTTYTQYRGTPKYSSPEHFGKKVSKRSDIYSLGVTLYEMLTGCVPIGSSQIYALALGTTPNLPVLQNYNKKIPYAVDLVIKKAMSREPYKRHDSCQNLFEDFTSALTKEDVKPIDDNKIDFWTNVETIGISDEILSLLKVDTNIEMNLSCTQHISFLKHSSNKSIQLSYIIGTRKGRARKINEDSVKVIDEEGSSIFAVSDGMGGSPCGTVASSLTVTTFRECILNSSVINRECIKNGVSEANRIVFVVAETVPELSGMGSTITGICFNKEKVSIFNVGNSRVYQVRKNSGKPLITQLTIDHTLVQELINSGSIKNHPFFNKPGTHMLTRSLGATLDIDIDFFDIPSIQEEDIFLICTDGVHDVIDVKGKNKFLTFLKEDSIEAIAKKILREIDNQDYLDDATFIIVKIQKIY